MHLEKKTKGRRGGEGRGGGEGGEGGEERNKLKTLQEKNSFVKQHIHNDKQFSVFLK